ncbi:putative gag-pol protein [Trichonephila clavipes]|nr:putative gag-pol protein [Trichonephila clavipes]
MSSKSSLMPVASTSSTQVQLFPSVSPIIPSIPCESQPPILNSNDSTDNSLHTSVPTLPSEGFILPSTSDRVENLSTEIQPPVPLLDTSPTTSSSQPSFLKVVNKNSKHCFTRWPEALPVMDIHAETVANAVYRGWISKFGSPSYIVTDQGTQFKSELFYELSKLLGFNCKCITAYHPQDNGLVERWHCTLCSIAMRWHQSLPTILLGQHTTIHEATSAELVFGENLSLPGDFLHDLVQQHCNTVTNLRPVLPSLIIQNRNLLFAMVLQHVLLLLLL